MREEYDFTNARKNPFAKKKKQITINIDASTIEYFNLIRQKSSTSKVVNEGGSGEFT
ncbi:hypothetical protein [Phascolarctobacterium succinatutens]|uniref:hypothetical protein n=1 Tax=Phascolarctobacterium succinatutens TaxID=626940 RepID=UPI0026EB77D7|nr:hypothetical protein [Phascolarctobacterium succinatutens]